MSKPLRPGQRFHNLLWRTDRGTVVCRCDDRRVNGTPIEAYTVVFDDGKQFEHWWRVHMRPESRLRFRIGLLAGKRPVPTFTHPKSASTHLTKA